MLQFMNCSSMLLCNFFFDTWFKIKPLKGKRPKSGTRAVGVIFTPEVKINETIRKFMPSL